MELTLTRRLFLVGGAVAASGGLVAGRTWVSSAAADFRTLLERVTNTMPCDEAGVQAYIRDFMLEHPDFFERKAWTALRMLLPFTQAASFTHPERLQLMILQCESFLIGGYVLATDALSAARVSPPSPEDPLRYIGLHVKRPCPNPFARFDLPNDKKRPQQPSQVPRTLFTTQGCAACHGAQAQGKLGPPLAGIEGSQVTLNNGEKKTRDRVYLRRAILDPSSEIVHNYTDSMPEYRSRLSSKQIDLLLDMLRDM